MSRIKQPGRGWAYTGAILGGLASIAANVAHSFLPPRGSTPQWTPEPGAVVGAIVWPVFLFIAVEILARTAWPRGWSWGILRWAGLLPVAGVAAFVSYRHLSGLLAHYGEEPIVYYLGPLAVDGLMIMATGALMAGGRAARASAAVRVETPAPPPVTTGPPVVPVASPPGVTPVAAPAVPTRMPTTSPPAPTRSPASAVANRVAAVPSPQPPAAASTPARSTNDTPVTGTDPGRRRSQIAPGLLARGRHVAEAHRSRNGTDIGAGELAVKLRIDTDRAKQLLAELANGDATPVNGTRRNTGTP